MTSVQDVINWAAGSTRANGSCQGFAGNDFTSAFGHFGYGYASANAAMAASKAAGTFHTGAPPSGQIVWVFYAFPTYGHVMLSLGDGRALGDTSQAKQWVNAKHTVGILPWNAYSYAYLGYATTNGVNTVPQIPTPNVNPYGNAGGQITVIANRRTTPTTSSAVMGQAAAGAWENLDGYCSEGQAVSGNSTWYHNAGGGWFSATVIAAVAPASLARLNADGTPWKAAPPPVVDYTVTFDFLDGDQSVTEEVVSGKPVTAVPIPTNSGYVFKEWTTDAANADPFDMTTPIVADLTLYASWEHVPVQPEPPTVDPPVVPPVTPTPPANNPPSKPVDQWGWLTTAIQAVGKFLVMVFQQMVKPPKL